MGKLHISCMGWHTLGLLIGILLLNMSTGVAPGWPRCVIFFLIGSVLVGRVVKKCRGVLDKAQITSTILKFGTNVAHYYIKKWHIKYVPHCGICVAPPFSRWMFVHARTHINMRARMRR